MKKIGYAAAKKEWGISCANCHRFRQLQDFPENPLAGMTVWGETARSSSVICNLLSVFCLLCSVHLQLAYTNRNTGKSRTFSCQMASVPISGRATTLADSTHLPKKAPAPPTVPSSGTFAAAN